MYGRESRRVVVGYLLFAGVALHPSVEAGLRRDRGDAETGAGVDVVGGLVVSAGGGLSLDMRADAVGAPS